MIKFFLTAVGLALPTFLLAVETNALPAVDISLSSPSDYQVVQRQTKSTGTVVIAGTILPETKETIPLDRLEACVSGKDLPGQWQPLPFDPRVAAFRGELAVPAGGWYRLEVRGFQNGQPIMTNTVDHVGVGEVFVIGGQSNSANYGEEKNKTQTGLVAAFDGMKWQLAADPEPGAGGKKGSFMPLFGDAMADRFHVPVGIVPVGIGSTSVREWLPAGISFSNVTPLTRNIVTVGANRWESSGKIFDDFTARMKRLGTNGFRAMLWHQGESDAKQADPQRTLPGTLYRQYLERLIRDSRREIGWDAPWFVAQVSYHSPEDLGSPDIREAQKGTWDDGVALAGPDTDTLTGDMREKNGAGIHLSAKGLRAHADLWVEKVGPWLDQRLAAGGQ